MMSEDDPDDNGTALPVVAAASVEEMQKKILPSRLFIAKADIIWPEEEESEPELDEEGKPKKKKKKKA